MITFISGRNAMKNLVELEQQALDAMKKGQYELAIPLWKEIVTRDPEWEHGSAFESLAICYEETGEIGKARGYHMRALELSPDNEIHRANWVSFLVSFGEPSDALDAGVKYLEFAAVDNTALMIKLLEIAETQPDQTWKAKLLAIHRHELK